MAFSSNSGSGPMADINVTPLVDVMLVLLIIFMITAPLMAHKVKVDLPLATLAEKPKIDIPPVTVTVQADGKIYWNDELMTAAKFDQNLALVVARVPQPQIDIRADNTTKYGVIQKVVLTIRGAGVRKVGFVSSPER